MDEVLSEEKVKKDNLWDGCGYSRWGFSEWEFSGGNFPAESLMGGILPGRIFLEPNQLIQVNIYFQLMNKKH